MNTETVQPNVKKPPKPVSRIRGSRSTLVKHDLGLSSYEGHDLKRADMNVIWSVGRTPREAIEALCKARWGGTLEGPLTPLPTDPARSDVRFTWGYRFRSDGGTGFKAAGVHVPGGVVLTWWK